MSHQKKKRKKKDNKRTLDDIKKAIRTIKDDGLNPTTLLASPDDLHDMMNEIARENCGISKSETDEFEFKEIFGIDVVPRTDVTTPLIIDKNYFSVDNGSKVIYPWEVPELAVKKKLCFNCWEHYPFDGECGCKK